MATLRPDDNPKELAAFAIMLVSAAFLHEGRVMAKAEAFGLSVHQAKALGLLRGSAKEMLEEITLDELRVQLPIQQAAEAKIRATEREEIERVGGKLTEERSVELYMPIVDLIMEIMQSDEQHVDKLLRDVSNEGA